MPAPAPYDAYKAGGKNGNLPGIQPTDLFPLH
jgi:hypothetical protein